LNDPREQFASRLKAKCIWDLSLRAVALGEAVRDGVQPFRSCRMSLGSRFRAAWASAHSR